MFTLTVFEILLFEGKSVLRDAQSNRKAVFKWKIWQRSLLLNYVSLACRICHDESPFRNYIANIFPEFFSFQSTE